MRKWDRAMLIVLACVAGLALAACGEDKPATPPAGAGGEAGKAEEKKADDKAPAEEKKAEEKAGEAAGKDEAAAAGAPTATDGAAPTAEQPGASKQEPEVRPEAPNIHMERTLQKVTAYGVTGPLAATRDRLLALLPPESRTTAATALDGLLAEATGKAGLKNMDWIDMERGIAFGFEGKDKPLLAIPIVSEEKFKEALPDGVLPDENHGYKFNDSYVLPYGKVLLVSDTFRTIDVIEGDLKLELTRVTTDKVLLVKMAGSSLRVLVGSLLDEMERGIGENMPMQQEQKEFLARFLNLVKEVVSEIDGMDLSLDVAGGEVVLRYNVTTVAGSKLGQSFDALRPGAFKAATLLPAKSFMVMSQFVPPDVYRPWLPRYVDLMASAWKLSDVERVDFGKRYMELVSYFGPDSAFSVYSDSAFPLSMTTVMSCVDGLQVRDKLYAFYDTIFQKALADLPPENRQMFANRTLKQVVDGLAPVFANLGIGLKMDFEDYRGAKVDYLVMDFDWEKLRLPPDAAWLTQVVQRQLGGAVAFSKEYVVFAFGPNPVVRAKEVLDSTPGLALADAFGAGFDESKYNLIFSVSAPKLLDALNEIPVVADFLASQAWVEKLRASRGFLGLGGKAPGAGGWFECRFDIGPLVEVFAPMVMAEVTPEPMPALGPAPAPTPAP